MTTSGQRSLLSALPDAPRGWRRVLPVLRRHPAVATPRVMGTTTGGMYLVGGLLALLGTATSGGLIADSGTVRTLSGLAAVVGLAVLLARDRIPRAAYHPIVAFGTVVITVGVAVSGSPSSPAFTSLYVFVAISSVFFSPLAAAAHLTLMLAGSAVAFAVTDGPLSWQLLSMGCTVCAAVVVGWLVRRADAAELDPLTGLLNRRGFDRELADAVTRAGRDGRPLALAMLDLDHFKLVNDSLGHAVGDQLLLRATQQWQLVLRPGQVLARCGGDEFAVVLPETSAEEAVVLVERLRERVPDGRTCSAGISVFEPGDSVSLLVNRTDSALYDAKRRGRDRTGHSEAMAAREDELRAGIERGELFLLYQPVVQLPDERVVGREALLRWRHPRSGVLNPVHFIPDAERGPLVHELGRWVLDHALADCAGWRAAHPAEDGPPPVLAVNVAGPELRLPGYAAGFAKRLASHGVPAAAVVLEVTESTLDADSPDVAETLTRLRELGVHVALDDFGTGWSSLSRLDRLPVDILKIDSSFVAGLAEPGADPTMLRTVVAIGRALALDVVAEGVETPAQAAAVLAAGCGFAQGYHHGRPQPLPTDVPQTASR